MTHNISLTAKAMTAIAAALALTSTASFAQDAATAPDTSVETTAASDPLAPEPAAEESSTTTEAAPPPASQPKVETRTTAAKSAKPAKASAPAARPAARRASAAAPPPAPIATPAPASAETAAAAPLPAEPLPPAAEPAPPPVAEPAPAGGMAGALMAEVMADDRLPYAGGAAFGLLALGGAGLVSRRRKRRRENEAFETRQQFLDQAQGEDAEPPVLELDRSAEVRPGPAFARPTPVHDPVPTQKAAMAGAPATTVPEGFDLSRFGRHVQAAYRGPTADNPSLSLKYRLRRGAALDQQERMAGEQAGSEPAATPAASIPASIPAQGKWEARPDADYLFRRAAKPAEREVEHH